MASLLSWFGNEAGKVGNTIGKAIGTAADAVVPGNQSNWHQPTNPQLPTRPQVQQRAPQVPQFHMPTLPSVNSRIPGLGVSPANITAQIPHAFGQVGNAGVQVGNQLLGDVSHLSDVISYPIVTKQYQDMANKGQISQATASQLMNEAGQKAGFNIGDKGATVLRKTAGAVAMPTATILTAGAAPEAVAGVKGLSLGAKVAQGVKTGVPVGAGFGALSTLGQQDKITPLGAATNIVGGGLMGGALGAGIPLAGAGLSKLARPVINDLKAGAPALANQSGHANFNAPIDKQGAIANAQAEIANLNQTVLAHQNALEQGKLQIAQNPMLNATQKDAQLRALEAQTNQAVNNTKQAIADWQDHVTKLGGEAPLKPAPPVTGVPVDTRMPYDPTPKVPTIPQRVVSGAKAVAEPFTVPKVEPKPGFMGQARAILADQRGSSDLFTNVPGGKKPVPKDVQEVIDATNQMVKSGDLDSARAMAGSLPKEHSTGLIKAIDAEQTRLEKSILDEIVGKTPDYNEVDSPDWTIKQVAERLGKHLNAPGSVRKITGAKRTYTTPSGSVTVGGDMTSAIDNLIMGTDIHGFKKNMKVMGEKFGGVFKEISDMNIDDANFELLTGDLNAILAKRPKYAPRADTGLGKIVKNSPIGNPGTKTVSPKAVVDPKPPVAPQTPTPPKPVEVPKTLVKDPIVAPGQTPEQYAKAFGIPVDQAKAEMNAFKQPAKIDTKTPTVVKMGNEATKAKNAEAIATAKAMESQRNAPAPIKLPEVQAGDWKQAILNSRATKNLIKERANVAVESANKLSKNDHALLDALRTTEPSVLAKQAENPTAFLKAAKDAKAYNDYTHAIGTGQGQAIGYRKNYGASEQWDLTDKKTQEILDAYQAKLKSKPGYSKQRLIPDYKTGEAMGMKRLNPNFAADISSDAGKRQADIAELALAKGLNQAYPGKVAVGEIPRGYTALQIAHGTKMSMPTEIAAQLNRRSMAPKVFNPVLKGYDATNRGLKYASLGGGSFHSLATAGTTAGQQLLDATMHPTTIPGKLADNLKLIGGTLSKTVNDNVQKGWASNGAIHADGLSTLDRAHLSGVTLRPQDILGDANVKLMDKVENSKLNFIKSMHDMVFARQIPQAKQMMFEQLTKGMDSRNPADLVHMREVASAVNNLGGINRSIEGITPGAAQRTARFVLATDFTETKFRKLASALTTKGYDGTIARQMVIGKVMVMALPGLAVAAASGNLKTPQDWANEVAKQVLDPQIRTNIPDAKTGNNKIAKVPGTELSELSRIFLPMFTDQKNRLSGVQHYAEGRMASGLATLVSLVTNKDYFGAPVIANNADGSVNVGKSANNLIVSRLPIPISQGIKIGQGKQTAEEAALNTLGLRVTSDKTPNPNAVANVKAGTTSNNTALGGSPLVNATGTPEAKAAAKLKKANNAAAVEAGTRLGGTTSLDSAQTRIDNRIKSMPAGISTQSQQALIHYAKLNEQGKLKMVQDPTQLASLRVANAELKAANAPTVALTGAPKVTTTKTTKVKSTKVAKAPKIPKLPSLTKTAKFNIKTPKVPTVKVAVATPKFKAPKAIRAPKVAKALPRRTVKIAKLPKSRNVA